MNNIKPILDIKAYLNNAGSLIELLEDNEFSQEEKNLALYEACTLGKIKLVDALMDAGAEIDETPQGKNGFLIAIENNHLSVAMFLADRNVDIHTQKNKALIDASSKGNWDMVDFLIDCGANVNDQDGEALIQAVKNNHFDITELLLKNGVDADAKDSTPLRYAFYKGYKNIVDTLLDYNATPLIKGINHKSHYSLTPSLHSKAKNLKKNRLKNYIRDNFSTSIEQLKEIQSLKNKGLTTASKNILTQSLSPSALADLPVNPVKTDFKFEKFLTMVCSVNMLPPDEPEITHEQKKPKI